MPLRPLPGGPIGTQVASNTVSTQQSELDGADIRRAAPECLVLEPRAGAPVSDAPTVRIFLGTERAQYRAERIFLWSIECCRDPGRRYEIHLMKGLADLDCAGWTTGFTNYRFAIPHYAGGEGRAIYNDVDQIYLRDPGELFDLDLGGHGFLAVSPRDSSVALIDCAKMAEVWSLEAARSESKKVLLRRATEEPGLCGPLDGGWNTRDQDEYDPDNAKLYHFSTLATQPFLPFPERFVYQPHPHGELWYELERSADAAGYHPFTREAPSAAFRQRLESGQLEGASHVDEASFARVIRSLHKRSDATRLAVSPPPSWGGDAGLDTFALSSLAAGDLAEVEGILCLGGLEKVPDEDLGWVLDSLFRSARKFLLAVVRCPDTRGPAGSPPHGNLRAPSWWAAQFESASRRNPETHWELATGSQAQLVASATRTQFGGRFLGEGEPSVWVLDDDRPGNTTQSAGLAEELGWPTVTKPLEFGSFSKLHNGVLGASAAGLMVGSRATLHEPWPDLVIAAGGRTAPVARWIKERSGGRTRLVQLGRKGANPARHFDLAVTPAYARLFPHPNRMEVSLPLTKVGPEALAAAAEEWREAFMASAGPRVAVLVGGDTAKHRLDAEHATKMGREIAEMANKAGASLFVTTSRRTSPEAVEALKRALPSAVHFHEWAPDAAAPNPYLGYLALADALIVTDDSESMLAEACATGKPVSIYPTPTRPPRLLERLKEAAVKRALEKPLGERGTPKPQGGIELFLARQVDSGLLRPARDLQSMRQHLAEQGRARVFDGELVLDEARPEAELKRVADRVRQLMGFRA
jgi:mitochondrial fission protein ELM1